MQVIAISRHLYDDLASPVQPLQSRHLDLGSTRHEQEIVDMLHHLAPAIYPQVPDLLIPHIHFHVHIGIPIHIATPTTDTVPVLRSNPHRTDTPPCLPRTHKLLQPVPEVLPKLRLPKQCRCRRRHEPVAALQGSQRSRLEHSSVTWRLDCSELGVEMLERWCDVAFRRGEGGYRRRGRACNVEGLVNQREQSRWL